MFIFLFSLIAFVIGSEEVGRAQELKQGFYPDGKLRYKGYFEDDRPIGKMTRYYPEGAVKAEMNYRGDTVDAILYDKQGTYKMVGQFVNRKKTGLWKYYKGEILLQQEEYKDNRLDGTVIRYYDSGKVAETKSWEKGVMSGDWKAYYDNGKLRISAVFLEGKLNGPIASFDYEGRLAAEGEYLNDLKEGSWKYYRNGELQYTRSYRQGIPENKEEVEREESRRLDELIRSGKKIPDPAVFADDPENYMRLIAE